MDSIGKTLATLRSRNVPELLEELLWIWKRVEKGERLVVPLVTLHLRSGRDVAGFIREIKRDNRGNWVVLHMPGFERAVREDVMFLGLESVEALTIHDLPALDRAPRDVPEPPGKLEVKRRIGDLKAKVSGLVGYDVACDALWDHFEDGEPLRGLDDAITQVGRIIEDIANEQLGLEALKTHLRAIAFDSGEASAAVREQQTLRVCVGRTPRSRTTEETLKRAIEAAL